ncbi:ABC transporter substrate-binding protein [Lactococcus allomyrinae]|uniref:Extracellular solute-binding protein n=1 Tax=Lactococcus allomyrinae TaxID=2419773 RepID=A0A387BN44_9LACT|nr:extracellular solute-binding protein [Lactococcus allomyrinae]AYF99940.1 extracellular solute-binding protein [Lactococcus allomyrinae]
MKFGKTLTISSVALASLVLLAACGNAKGNDATGKTTITFWAAPNPTQLTFWNKMAKNYEAQHPKVEVKVSEMKNSPTSEAYIQSAIASKTAPTMSENISRSFAAQLSESKAIIPLNKQVSFDSIVKTRDMSKTIAPWKFSDGNQYVLPVYSNPIFMAWRLDKLKELGFDKAPTTYSELEAVAAKLKGNKNLSLWAAPALVDPTAYQRWFDYFPLYYAASNGADWVKNGKYVADHSANKQVFELMSALAKDNVLQTGAATNPFENGNSLIEVTGAWVFANWTTQFPDLQYNKTYTITPPVVPDDMSTKGNINTYSDAKGVSIYASATKAQQKAAMDFLKFVFSDSKNDLIWLNDTSLTPARDDVTTNSTFTSYFDKNPQMKVIADMIPNAIPAIDNSKYNDIQQAFGTDSWIPVVQGKMAPEKAVAAAKTAVNGKLQ